MSRNLSSVITYNLSDRGRRFRGVNRNMDIAAAVRVINSPATQERLQQGDMVGYLGHWPREKFGMYPREGGLVDGKHVSLELAVRTVLLEADSDGTVRHQAEFLPTSSGNIAHNLYTAKTGGFSSAIDARPVAGVSVPFEFYGFDYVYEPNYATNRGYLLDSAGNPIIPDDDQVESLFDEVAERQALLVHIASLLDTAHADRTQLLGQIESLTDALEHTGRQNDELVAMLAAHDAPVTPVLDMVNDVLGSRDGELFRAADFLQARLEGLPTKQAKKPAAGAAEALNARRWG